MRQVVQRNVRLEMLLALHPEMQNATGIEADGMIMTLFSDTGCTALITDFETDGRKVIPLDVS